MALVPIVMHTNLYYKGLAHTQRNQIEKEPITHKALHKIANQRDADLRGSAYLPTSTDKLMIASKPRERLQIRDEQSPFPSRNQLSNLSLTN